MSEWNGGFGLKRIANGRPATPEEGAEAGSDTDELYDAQVAKLRCVIRSSLDSFMLT